MKPRAVLILALTLGLLAAPRAAEAQQARKMWRIGLLGKDDTPYRPFIQALHDLGWIEGQNIVLERRFTSSYDRLVDSASELVRVHIDLIVAPDAPSVKAAKTATQTIPIVMAPAGGPVSAGFVSSVAHPGGNITGVAIMHTELSGKRLEFLAEAVPSARRIAVLADPKNPSTPAMLDETERGARALDIDLVRFEVTAAGQFISVFASMARQQVGALVVLGDPFFYRQSREIVRLALQHRLAGMYEWREMAEAGGLMSYGPRQDELRRKAATYVDKLLKGTKPADLPSSNPRSSS
jgi:putative ABC transport system substrate-binding protein